MTVPVPVVPAFPDRDPELTQPTAHHNIDRWAVPTHTVTIRQVLHSILSRRHKGRNMSMRPKIDRVFGKAREIAGKVTGKGKLKRKGKAQRSIAKTKEIVKDGAETG